MPKVNAKPKTVVERPVVFPEVIIELAQGDNAMTAATAKELVGWEEVETKDSACCPEIFAICKKHVRLHNNTCNRYLTPGWLLTLRQEHLQKRWRLNGETIVIGNKANVLSGQHRLIALILAQLLLEVEEHWKELWPDGFVTMETFVIKGIDEGDDTFKTLNCGKPGTFAEVLFRSEHLSNFKSSTRKNVSRMTDYAIRLLWERTGESTDAFHPRRTHGEMMDFIARHPKLLKAVKHIYEENQVGKDADGKAMPPSIGQHISIGYAAGILYLMAAGGTEGDYLSSDRTEKDISLKFWAKAEEFWVNLSKGVRGEFKGVVNAIGSLRNPNGEGGGSLAERIAILCNSWAKFVDGKRVQESDVALKPEHYKEEDGERHFVYKPTFGGIDLGGKPKVVKPTPTEDAPNESGDAEPTPEEIEAKKAEMKAAKVPAKTSEADFLKVLRAKTKKGSVMLVKSKSTDNYYAYAEDADTCAKHLNSKVEVVQDIKRVVVTGKELDASVKKLVAAKLAVAVLTEKRTGPEKADIGHDVKEYSPAPIAANGKTKPAAKPVARK